MTAVLIVAEGYDYEIVEKMNHPHDDYSILVTLKANGTVEKTVVGSVMESLALDSEDDAQFSTPEGDFLRSLPADGNFYHHRKGLQPRKRF